jgi:hypothetical protein
MGGGGLDFLGKYVANTPRKLAIFAIVFFASFFILGFTYGYVNVFLSLALAVIAVFIDNLFRKKIKIILKS